MAAELESDHWAGSLLECLAQVKDQFKNRPVRGEGKGEWARQTAQAASETRLIAQEGDPDLGSGSSTEAGCRVLPGSQNAGFSGHAKEKSPQLFGLENAPIQESRQ